MTDIIDAAQSLQRDFALTRRALLDTFSPMSEKRANEIRQLVADTAYIEQ